MSAGTDSLVLTPTSYPGTFSSYFILPEIYGLDSVSKNILHVEDGIQKEFFIRRMNFDSPWQPRVSDPTTGGGDIVVTERGLTPQNQMLYQPFNPRDLEDTYDGEAMAGMLVNRQLTPSFQNYVAMIITERAMQWLENEIWMGSTQYQNNPNVPQFDINGNVNSDYQLQFFDGFMKQFVSDSAIYVDPSPSTITSANIQTKLSTLYQLVATNYKALIVRKDRYEKMKFIVSIKTLLIYEEAQVSQTFKNIDMTRTVESTYKGFDVVAVAGMPDDSILFTDVSPGIDGNLWWGINSVTDENFIMDKVLPSSERWFLKMLFKGGTAYPLSDKIFLHTLLTAASFVR
jgi:hypothetical protein